jgi:outer membrane receptor protein involved in Fe transport
MFCVVKQYLCVAAAIGAALAVLAPVGEMSAAVIDGSVRGVVIDTRGRPLSGVAVSFTSARLGIAAALAASDAAGRFQSTPLPAGDDYVVKASLAGFATIVVPEIAVAPGRATQITVTLPSASSVRESVSVRAERQVVDLDERGATTRVSSEFIDSLPILGRNYQDVLTLAPGVTDVNGTGNPNIHGARDTSVGTLVDGVNTTDPLTGKIGAQLNLESIQEIEVKTAGATAEFGRAQGGFANIITRSGGNDFEGVFKFYWRGSALDGDGAGADPPYLHGGVGESGLRSLTFNDYLPFLSLSGPIVKDHAWFFATAEWIQKEEPTNAVSQAFVTGLREKRLFAKATWQASANNRLALSLNYDPQEFLNQGLNSLTMEETGFTLKAGGPLLSLRDTAVLSPSVALESTVSWFESRPALEPNLGPDTNHDGILYIDRNHDGFQAANERDPGEDFDQDGAFDTWEDTLRPNGLLDETEEPYCPDSRGFLEPVRVLGHGCSGPVVLLLDEDHPRPSFVWPQFPSGDGDHRLTPPGGCEGGNREDIDCDGHLDNVNEDRNHNGVLDPGEDRDGDGRLDLGTEDRNHNGRLDDTPFPTTTYPYGHLRPVPADRDYTIDLRRGLVNGPYYQDYDDRRSRFALRQDLSVFVPDRGGVHDVKGGYIVEREQFDRTAGGHGVVAVNDPGWLTGKLLDQVQHPDLHYDCNPYEQPCPDPGLGRMTALLPINPVADEQAEGLTAGLYIQDTWRPVPTFSLTLGLRFDRETATSHGETFFDPRAERRRADRLISLSGSEAKGGDDLRSGNGDGLINAGIPGDPLFGATTGDTVAALQARALASFTLNPTARLFGSQALESQFPQIFVNGTLDIDAAAALGIQVQQPETFRITNDNLSPRLGASWDPAGDGRSKLFAAWGRYYDRLFLSSVTGEQGVQTINRYYVLDRDGVDLNTDSNSVVQGSVPNDHFGTLLSGSPPTVTQVDRGLRTPYSDEWMVGFEREVSPETSLAVRYINRHYRDQLQDIDINHANRIDPRTHQPTDFFGALATVTDPMSGQTSQEPVPDGKPDLYVNDVFFNQVLRVGNFNTAVYHGIELELRRRLSHRWQIQGSYTYSRALGQAEDFQSRLGNDPSTVQSEYGYLDFDQRHVVKASGAFFLQGDWQLGTSATWASGLPYSIISRFLALDNVEYLQFRTLYGMTVQDGNGVRFETIDRNSGRNGSTLDLNASVRKNFVLGHAVWAASLEVFNLLNRDELRIHTYEPNSPTGFDASSAALIASPQRLDAERRFGRRFQLGFQVQF